MVHDIKIDGVFMHKTKIFSDNIIKISLDKYLNKDEITCEKFINYFDKIKEIHLVNTQDYNIITKTNDSIIIKANSDIEPKNIIDILINDIDNFKPNIKNLEFIIEGTFIGKSQKYSDGIIKLKFEDYLDINKDNKNKIIEYCNKQNNDNIIKIKIENIDNETINNMFNDGNIIIKANSKIYSPG
jgi:hypothetical protein